LRQAASRSLRGSPVGGTLRPRRISRTLPEPFLIPVDLTDSISARARRTRSKTALPPSVSRAPEPFRLNTVRPNSSSRRGIRRLIVDGLIPKHRRSVEISGIRHSDEILQLQQLHRHLSDHQRREALEWRRNSASPKAELRHRSLSELVARGPLISFHPKTLRPSFSRDAAKSSQQRQRPDRRGDDIVARS
jgi:hypothetical protein